MGIICKACKKETPAGIKHEFLCFGCYDKQIKVAEHKPRQLPKFWKRTTR